MARIRFFGPARAATGLASDEIEAADVAEILARARARYGPGFAEVLATSAIWLNGDPAAPAQPLTGGDEVAILPPLSGG